MKLELKAKMLEKNVEQKGEFMMKNELYVEFSKKDELEVYGGKSIWTLAGEVCHKAWNEIKSWF